MWDIFGHGYGPRLTVPWVLPIVLTALVAYGDPLGDLVLRLLSSLWRVLLVFTVVFVFTLPHVGHMWSPEATNRFAQDKQSGCEAPWRNGVEKWHSCQHDLLWFNNRPRPLHSAGGVRTAGGVAISALLAVAVLGCLLLLREEMRARPQ